MSERIKLSEPGDELVMEIDDVSTETIDANEYAKFTGNGKELLMPMSSLERQFERLDAKGLRDMIGMTVKFSRSTKLSKYGKPFWNCDIATKADLKMQVPSKRLTEAQATRVPGEEVPANPDRGVQRDAERPTWATLVQGYATAWNAAKDVQGAGGTPDSIQAGAATLLITADKRGVVIPAPASKRIAPPFRNDMEEENEMDIPF